MILKVNNIDEMFTLTARIWFFLQRVWNFMAKSKGRGHVEDLGIDGKTVLE